VHHLQGKAEGVSADLATLLREFYLARVALLMRHEEVSRHVTDYDVNNAYQYIVSREETHLSWLQHALLDVGAAIPPDPARAAVPAPPGRNGWKELAAEDARAHQAFVQTWKPRVGDVTNARHRGMLNVVLGEMLEQKRFFDQAAEGRTDLLGTHLPINERRGVVHSDRWIE
jgi:hypothetical protein